MAPKKKLTAAERRRADADRMRAVYERKNRESADDGKKSGFTGGGLMDKIPTGGGLLAKFKGGDRDPFLGDMNIPGARPEGRSPFLAEIGRKVREGQGGGALGGIGMMAGGGLYGAGQQVGAGLKGSLDSLLSSISQNFPQAPQAPGGFSPALVDVGATLAPYGAARENLTKQYDTNKGRLGELAQAGTQDTAAVEAATQRRLADLERLRQVAAQRDAQGARADGQGSVASLQALGVDPSLVAAAQEQQRAAGASAAAASDGGLDMIADQKRQAAIEAARSQGDLQASSRNANTSLDQNLFMAMAGLGADELKAKTEAERYNAEATQQAAMAGFDGQRANYQAQMDRMNQLAGLPGALTESAQSLGAFDFPGRAGVLDEIQRTTNTTDGIGRVLMQSLNSTDNPDDAMESIVNGIAAYNDERVKSGAQAVTPSMERINRQVRDYFAQDGSLTNTGFSQLARLFNGMKAG